MQTAAIIEGMTILEKYRNREDGFNTGAEHDVIYAYATDKPVSTEDLERLVKLGWFQGDVDCGEEKFAAKHYDPQESWKCFA